MLDQHQKRFDHTFPILSAGTENNSNKNGSHQAIRNRFSVVRFVARCSNLTINIYYPKDRLMIIPYNRIAVTATANFFHLTLLFLFFPLHFWFVNVCVCVSCVRNMYKRNENQTIMLLPHFQHERQARDGKKKKQKKTHTKRNERTNPETN